MALCWMTLIPLSGTTLPPVNWSVNMRGTGKRLGRGHMLTITRGIDALLEKQLGQWTKLRKLHIYFISTSGVKNIVFFFHSMSSGFRDTDRFFKIAIFRHETWPLEVWEVAHIISFNPRGGGSNLSLFRSTGSSFWDTGPFLKLPYFSMKLGHWPKCQQLHIYPLSNPGGRNRACFSSTAVVSEILADFQNCHIWAWNLAIGQSSRSCTYSLFLPQGVENLACFNSTGSGFQDTGRFSKFAIFRGMKLGHWPKFQKLHIYFLNYTLSPKFHSILL